MKTKNIFLILLLALIFIPSFALAVNPKEVQTGGVLQIEYPKTTAFKFGEDFEIHFHVYDEVGDIVSTNDATCSMYLYGLMNEHLLEVVLHESSNLIDFDYVLNTSIITQTGVYSYLVDCISGTDTGFISSTISVTRTGEEEDNIRPIFIILGLFSIIILFLYITFNLGEEHWGLKLFLMFFSIIIMQLIPKTVYDYSSGQVALTFITFYSFFIKIFFTYVVIYFTYIVLEYLGYAAQIKGYMNSRMRGSGFKK